MPTSESRIQGGYRKGFTLVELLVVIGIIALLISVLLPALNKAREAANTTKCLANLRQCGMALNMYVNEYKGWFPYCARDNTWKPWAAQFFGAPNPGAVGTQTGDAQRSNVHRGIMKYLGAKFRTQTDEMECLETKLLMCPSAMDWPLPSNFPSRYNQTSYCANGVFANRKITNIKKSADVIAFSESRFVWNVSALRPYPAAALLPGTPLDTIEYMQWMWVEGGSIAGPNKLLNFTLHTREQKGNVCFVDGHGETLSYRDIKPKDFGLGDGNPSNGANQGKSTDTYVEIAANGLLRYSANLK